MDSDFYCSLIEMYFTFKFECNWIVYLMNSVFKREIIRTLRYNIRCKLGENNVIKSRACGHS